MRYTLATIYLTLGVAALALLQTPARAGSDADAAENAQADTAQPGTLGQNTPEASDEMNPKAEAGEVGDPGDRDQRTANNTQSNSPNNSLGGNPTPSQRIGNQAKAEENKAFGPQTIAIETALQRTLAEIQGARSQLSLSQKTGSPAITRQLKTQGKQIDHSIKQALSQTNSLQTQSQRFPDIAQSDDFRSVQASLKDLKSLNDRWQAKLAQSSYLRNPNQVSSDLDALENQVKDAINRTHNFSSGHLNIQNVG